MPSEADELRERIEALAMRAVLDEPPSVDARRRFSAEVEEIGRFAGVVGCAETARAAAALAKVLLEEQGGCLEQGVASLQAALDEDDRLEPAPASNSLAQDPELIGDFVVESREHLSSVETQALVLEQDPANAEAVHSLFRSFHTIKGLAGFLEMASIQETAHEVETLLDFARNGQLAVHSGVIDVILESADWLSHAVDSVEAGTGSPPVSAELLARVERAAAGEETAAPVTAPEPGEAAPAPTAATTPRKTENSSVRVDAAKLDYLMDMVGEMVIAQSLIRHDPALENTASPNLARNMSQLARITTEVQRTTMAMRMIPIGQVFKRTARLIRDLSRKAGKAVELEVSGEDTELDKTIAEELSDPLLHMVRNSIDHGFETAAEREAAGKPPVGHMRLAAFHHSGHIVIEVADDGRGLNREKILNKARQRGLVTGEAPSDSEVWNLIFEPGFSTAEQVTDVSGRGVGMDVVRKHLQKLRGRVDIDTQPGHGTRFSIRLPLTLAIIEGLVVGVGAYRYIVPIFAVREVFRPSPDAVSTVQGRDEMVLVHERLMPLVRLHRRFGLKPRCEDPCEAVLIVSETEGKPFCMMVDDLIGKQEVVIKSLGEALKNIAGVAGGTILGDGRVGLILEMNGIFGGGNGD